MYGTALAEKPCAKLFENRVAREQNAPAAVRCVRIVVPELSVVRKRNRIRDLYRFGENSHINVEPTQHRHELFIEIGHSTRFECQRLLHAVAAVDEQFVIDEVELDLKSILPVWNR